MAAQRSVTLKPGSPMAAFRKEFPALQTRMHGKPLVYLDSAASAQKPRAVIDAMNSVLEGGYSNIHRGLYEISQNLTHDFENVRDKIARFIGAQSSESIVFTRNATEAVNLVAQSWGRTFLKAGDEVILSEMEHHANIVPWQMLREQAGIVIRVAPVRDDGTLDLEKFAALLSPKTRLIGLVHISNAFGIVNPVKEIIAIARAKNPDIRILIDGSQAVVHSPVHMGKMDADFYVFTGHKLYGPTGIGVLYGKKEILNSMPPYQGGGDMIASVSFEKTLYREPPARFEAGTPPILEVIGLGAAIDYVESIGLDAIAAHEAALLGYGTDVLRRIDGVKIYGDVPGRAPILSFTMDTAHISDIGMVLDQQGIAVRTGHHCCMPLMVRFAIDGTVRASFGLYTNRDDIDQLAEGLGKVRELFA